MIKFKYGSKEDFNKNDGVKLFDKDIQHMIDECVSRLESNEDWATFQGRKGYIYHNNFFKKRSCCIQCNNLFHNFQQLFKNYCSLFFTSTAA